MSKELYFTDGNNEVKYLDTTASFNLAITQDGSAFDLTNATAIDVKVANDTGYVFDKSIDMTTITQPLAGLITMPVDAEVMNALVPDDYTIEVWVTLSSLVTPGSQEGLTDDGSTTENTTPTTTTYNAIFPSDDPQGFSITDNVMSDSGDVIPVMSLDAFQQEFNQLKIDLTNQVSTLQGPAGKDGKDGKDGATGPQGPQGIQGPKGDTGQGLEIKGKVDTTSQLPATASEGDGYLVAEELYVWTDNEWKDCGQIQGPAGKDGATGPQGPAGKDGTQVDLSNYATQQQLATKADTSAIDPSVLAKTTLTADDDVLTLADGMYRVWKIVPKNLPAIGDGSGSDWGYITVKSINTGTRWVTFSNVLGNSATNILSGSPATWGGWRVPNSTTMASKTDLTTAISTATANMVDSSKPTNFTDGLQSGGVDVATAADLKSIEDSAWHELDNKYVETVTGTTVSPNTTILYKVDDVNKKLYLQGSILLTNALSVNATVNLNSIVKTVTGGYVRYLGSDYGYANWTGMQVDTITHTGIVFSLYNGTAGIVNDIEYGSLSHITYDELV
ncbi:hypothetical protein [Levilactobacillus brevis]|uniref:hypothetical protein n=1 Tax=Levilactobacillus brevis TaxID=1580 RepID=UPI0032615C72